MYNKIKLLAQQYHQETIQTRRDFHKSGQTIRYDFFGTADR